MGNLNNLLSFSEIKSHINVVIALECLIIFQQSSNRSMNPDNHQVFEEADTSCHSHWYSWQFPMNTWGWENILENTQETSAKTILRQERKIENRHQLINARRQEFSGTQLQHLAAIHCTLGFTSPEISFHNKMNKMDFQICLSPSKRSHKVYLLYDRKTLLRQRARCFLLLNIAVK